MQIALKSASILDEREHIEFQAIRLVRATRLTMQRGGKPQLNNGIPSSEQGM